MKCFRNLLRGVSLTAALFVFQACYGTPAAYQPAEPVEDVAETASDADVAAETAAEDGTVSDDVSAVSE